MSFIDTYKKDILELCNTHHVERMYLFGSMANSTNTINSDVDLLVKFKPMDLAFYFTNFMDLKSKLSVLFQKDVDLLEEQTFSNPYLIESINKSKSLIYG